SCDEKGVVSGEWLAPDATPHHSPRPHRIFATKSPTRYPTPATPSPTTNMSMPLRITPRPVNTLRAAPTAKCESIAIVNAIHAAVGPLNRRNGATGMNAPTAVDTPVNHPSLNGVACAS